MAGDWRQAGEEVSNLKPPALIQDCIWSHCTVVLHHSRAVWFRPAVMLVTGGKTKYINEKKPQLICAPSLLGELILFCENEIPNRLCTVTGEPGHLSGCHHTGEMKVQTLQGT